MSNAINFINDILKTIKKNKYVILLFSILLSLAVSFYARSINEKYSTFSRIFPLSFNKSSSSPVDAIKAQFGITDKTDYSVIYNITVLVNSKTITKRLANSKTNNKKYKTLADWLIDDFNKNKSFYQKKIVIKSNDTLGKSLTGADLATAAIKITTEKTEFTEIVTKTGDKELSKELNLAILKEISDYYIQIATEKPRTDLSKIQTIRDSLRIELGAIESAIAGFQDANQFSSKYSNGIPQTKLIRSRAEIEQLYATTASAYQNARFKLLSESPIFQVLDYPGEPYEKVKPSWLKYGIITFLVMLFMTSIFSCRKVFMKMILEELNKSN